MALPYYDDAEDYLRHVLSTWGLNQPSLMDWVMSMLREGRSVDMVLFDMERRPEYDAAFPEIRQRRERMAETGAQYTPIGPSEILEYRTQAAQLMRSFGLPQSFYNTNSAFRDLIVNDVSLAELNDRLEYSSRRVVNAPPEVRSVFADLFGNTYQADQALYLLFVDPDRALPDLEEMVQQAEAGGAARRLGFGLTSNEAERMALANITYEEALRGFTELDARRGLFDETLYEEDFTVGDEGIAAQFGLGGGAAERLAQRGEQRKAETSGSAGGAIEERGVTGLGAAGRR